MISAGIEGRLPYMTYPEPWGGPPKQPPEFLRPAPKPLPPTRYNGMTISTALNGTRIGTAQRSPSCTPVNLSQTKQEEVVDEIQYSPFPRLFVPPPPFTYHPTGPYATLYQPPFTPILRASYITPTKSPASPLETKYSPTTLSPNATTIHSVPSTYNSSTSVLQQHQLQQHQQHKQKYQQHHLQLQQQLPQTTVSAERKPSPSFKVPSGKEGSLKHRILTRPGDPVISRVPLDSERLQDTLKVSESVRKRLTATVSPPKSPAKIVHTNNHNNNNVVPAATFTKGSLIQLANGELRKVEELRTEDFVNSAERSPELRLADSTVVRLKENPTLGTTAITLTYNQRRTQVEFETSIEHPFFVYGQGWASCAPDRTLQVYGLKVHRLLVGDILISLTPRENTNMPISTKGTTIITTATTTAVTARQISATNTQQMPASYNMLGNSFSNSSSTSTSSSSSYSKNQLSPDCVNNSNKKRRWSAPDQICDEDEQISRRVKI